MSILLKGLNESKKIECIIMGGVCGGLSIGAIIMAVLLP
jgi:nucleoside phosphorylase